MIFNFFLKGQKMPRLTDGQTDERTYGRMDERTDRRTDGRTHGRTHEQTEFFFGLRAYNYFTTHTLLNNHSCLLAKAADTNLATTYFFA